MLSSRVFDSNFVPFRYQGQYHDLNSGLYYNRFRYYDPEMGQYISQDSIGLTGGNPTLYGYVQNPNAQIDPWGLFEIDPNVDFIITPEGVVLPTKDVNLISTSPDGQYTSVKRVDHHTTANDINYAEEQLRNGNMEERSGRKETKKTCR